MRNLCNLDLPLFFLHYFPCPAFLKSPLSFRSSSRTSVCVSHFHYMYKHWQPPWLAILLFSHGYVLRSTIWNNFLHSPPPPSLFCSPNILPSILYWNTLDLYLPQKVQGHIPHAHNNSQFTVLYILSCIFHIRWEDKRFCAWFQLFPRFNAFFIFL